jgi:hypothetical protein
MNTLAVGISSIPTIADSASSGVIRSPLNHGEPAVQLQDAAPPSLNTSLGMTVNQAGDVCRNQS